MTGPMISSIQGAATNTTSRRDAFVGYGDKACTAGLCLCIAILYFKSILLIVLCTVASYRLAIPFIALHKKAKAGKQLRKELLLWFEELTIALKSGDSLTSALRDLAISVTDSSSRIRGDTGHRSAPAKYTYTEISLSSWRRCLGLLNLHYPIAYVLRELAEGLELPELRSLAALVGSAVETGADLSQVFIRSALALREQIDSVEALEAALASRRLEGCLLAVSPAVYAVFLRLSTPGYMAPLYIGKGKVIALVVYSLQLMGSYAFFRILTREESYAADLELAGFQEDISLHFYAGLSLPEAWQRAAYSRYGEEAQSGGQSGGQGRGQDGRQDGGLSADLMRVAGRLAMGASFGRALESIQTREGGGSGLRRLADLLSLNYRLGGGLIGTLLTLEAKELRQRCLMSRQGRDQRRQTILLFPMILLLLSALILTAAPAMLSL